MSKYFTPITELPGDSGKSESAAAMVRYKRSTSNNNKFSKSLSSSTRFVSPQKMFPASTKQSVPNSGKFLKRGKNIQKGDGYLDTLLRELAKFGSLVSDSSKDIGPFVDAIRGIPLTTFDELIKSKIPDKLLDDLDVANVAGDAAEIKRLQDLIAKAKAVAAFEVNAIKQRVLEYSFGNPAKSTVIAPLTTPYPKNIFEGWSQLTEGLSESANPSLVYANLTNKPAKLTNENAKLIGNPGDTKVKRGTFGELHTLRGIYGDAVDKPEFRDALNDYYNSGDTDYFTYNGLIQDKNTLGFPTLLQMKHNNRQIRDIIDQNAKNVYSQEKITNGYNEAIKKPLLYGSIAAGTALTGKAIYDWLNQNDALEENKKPTAPIAPTPIPIIPGSKFNFDLPVRETSNSQNGSKLARMGKLKKDGEGILRTGREFIEDIINLITNSSIKLNADDLKLLILDLETKTVPELTKYYDDLVKTIDKNNAYSLNSSTPSALDTALNRKPKKNKKDIEYENATTNILRLMNINGVPANIVSGMERALRNPDALGYSRDEILTRYNKEIKNLNMGGKFENFFHGIGTSIDNAQAWTDSILGQSYRNQSIEDWNKLSTDNKERLIESARKLIPADSDDLGVTSYSGSTAGSTRDLDDKALVDRAFSQGAYRFGRLNPSFLQVNSTAGERFASNLKDVFKNPQQTWAKNTLLSPLIAIATAYPAYKGIDAIKDWLLPEPEPDPTSKNSNPIPSKYSPKKGESAYIDMLRNPPLVQNAKNIKEIESKTKELPVELPKNESSSSMAQIDIDSILPKRLSSMAITNNPNQPKDFINDLLYGAMEGQSRLSNATLNPNSSLYDNPLSTKRNSTWNAYHLGSDDLKWMVDMALKNNENIANIPDAAQYLVQQDAALKERQKINQENRTKQISEWADNRDIKSELDKDDWLANINLSSSPTQSLDFPRYKPNYATPDYLAYAGKTKKRASSVQKADSVWNRDKFYERKPLKTPDTPEYVTSTTNTRWDSMSDKEKGRMAATQAFQEAKKKYKKTSDVVQHTIQRAGEIASDIGLGAIGVTGMLIEGGISGFNDLKRKTKSSKDFMSGVADVYEEKVGTDQKEKSKRQKMSTDMRNKFESGIKSLPSDTMIFANSMIEQSKPVIRNAINQSKPIIRNMINQSKPIIRNMINQSKSGLSHLAENASDVSQDVINGITNWMQSNSSKGKTTKRYVEKSMDFQKSMTTANPIEQNQPTIQKHRNKYIDGK